MNAKNEILINKYSHPLRTLLRDISIKYQFDNVLRMLHKRKGIKETKEYMQAFSEGHLPLFRNIAIETINRCNGLCSFCPANKKNDDRPYMTMDENIFLSIVEQLQRLHYTGLLGLSLNNEPFLDKRIVSFAKTAKTFLPDAKIYLFTNGSVLSLEKFLTIIPYLDGLTIDNYNDNLELNKFPKIIYEYCVKNPDAYGKVQIHLRKRHEVLTTRAGQAPNNQKKRKTLHVPCIYPYTEMAIRPDGKASLCCNDALGKMTLGDLNGQTLLEIWNSDIYTDIRRRMAQGREHISLCRFCDC